MKTSARKRSRPEKILDVLRLSHPRYMHAKPSEVAKALKLSAARSPGAI